MNGYPSSAIACFITPHGFGHAARALAVMLALRERSPSLRFRIFTTVPAWFFVDLGDSATLHPVETDIGLVQQEAFCADLQATARRLDTFLPFSESLLDRLAENLAGCRLALCDVAALGVAAAERAGIPSVLLENFTWDWIYRGYSGKAPGLDRAADILEGYYRRATLRIQAEPVCRPFGEGVARVPPVSCPCRLDRGTVRALLGVREEERLVAVSMGGMHEHREETLARLAAGRQCVFLVTAAVDAVTRRGALIEAPRRGTPAHAEILAAADAVVCKAGYSTVAELYHAGTPFGYFLRDDFPESPPLDRFIREKMAGIRLGTELIANAGWMEVVEDLLALPRRPGEKPNGAGLAAEVILPFLATS